MTPKTLKLTKQPSILERYEQEAFFSWVRTVRYCGEPILEDCHAIPNGSFLAGDASRRAIQGDALRRQGVKAGYPDVAIDIAVEPYHGMRIEVKRIGAPTPPPHQVAAQERLRYRGYRVDVCYGFEQMREATLQYLGISDK